MQAVLTGILIYTYESEGYTPGESVQESNIPHSIDRPWRMLKKLLLELCYSLFPIFPLFSQYDSISYRVTEYCLFSLEAVRTDSTELNLESEVH